MNEPVLVLVQILTLSDGTFATLTGEKSYDVLTNIRWGFYCWTRRQIETGLLSASSTWQKAWSRFASSLGSGEKPTVRELYASVSFEVEDAAGNVVQFAPWVVACGNASYRDDGCSVWLVSGKMRRMVAIKHLGAMYHRVYTHATFEDSGTRLVGENVLLVGRSMFVKGEAPDPVLAFARSGPTLSESFATETPS